MTMDFDVSIPIQVLAVIGLALNKILWDFISPVVIHAPLGMQLLQMLDKSD